ncbi:MAG: hypothetical protein AB1798_23440, partial [Spirochaetota bacterium]
MGSYSKVYCGLKKLPAAFLLVCITLVYFACNENPPEILEVFWQLNLVNDKKSGAAYESLSLFAHTSDEDGFDDLESLYLISDDEELFWKLNADNWIKSERDNEIWVGSNNLQMADYNSIPRKECRLILIDNAGERDEKRIYISSRKINLSNFSFPELVIESDGVLIKSRYKTNS